MILVIDNYDSFVFNLTRHIRQLVEHETIVIRNDSFDTDWVASENPAAIIISPGPCTPQLAGHSMDVIQQFHRTIPILGVCLGHQAIVESLGGATIRSNQPVHGRSSPVTHNGSELFADVPPTFAAGRYHSLCADPTSIPKCLNVTATTDDQTIMAVQHCEYPVFGLQFHPESILTEHGYTMISNFLRAAGLKPCVSKIVAEPKTLSETSRLVESE